MSEEREGERERERACEREGGSGKQDMVGV